MCHWRRWRSFPIGHSISAGAKPAHPPPVTFIDMAIIQAAICDALPGEEFDTLIGRPGYHQRNNGDLERREGTQLE